MIQSLSFSLQRKYIKKQNFNASDIAGPRCKRDVFNFIYATCVDIIAQVSLPHW